MAAWGHSPFDNDAVQYWMRKVLAEDVDATVRSALEVAIAGGYLEVDEGSVALAAAAFVAASLDGDLSAVPESARQALRSWRPADDLAGLAARAIAAVSASSSELASLWRSDQAWRSAVARIGERLHGRKAKAGAAGTQKRRKVKSEAENR